MRSGIAYIYIYNIYHTRTRTRTRTRARAHTHTHTHTGVKGCGGRNVVYGRNGTQRDLTQSRGKKFSKVLDIVTLYNI